MNPSTERASGLPATDTEALARLEGFGGRALLDQMIVLFLESASERLASAALGLASNDAPRIENALHALKSSSAQLGAVRLSSLCEQGETIARAGTLAPLAELLDASRRELTLVEAWLNGVRRERRA